MYTSQLFKKIRSLFTIAILIFSNQFLETFSHIVLYNGGHSRLIRDVTAFRLKESLVLCTVHRCQYCTMGKRGSKNGNFWSYYIIHSKCDCEFFQRDTWEVVFHSVNAFPFSILCEFGFTQFRARSFISE